MDPPAQDAAPLGTESILLVEDDDGVRKLAGHVLKRHGYIVREAATPSEALRVAAAHANEIQLIVSDVVMPEMSGSELVSQLRVHLPHARVLHMSGHQGSGSPEYVGFDGILLIKPFNASDLLEHVPRLLDRPRT